MINISIFLYISVFIYGGGGSKKLEKLKQGKKPKRVFSNA
jgi:hypothetical protein